MRSTRIENILSHFPGTFVISGLTNEKILWSSLKTDSELIKHPLSYFMHSACGSRRRFSSREPGHHRRTDPRSAMRRGDGGGHTPSSCKVICDARGRLVCGLMTLCWRWFCFSIIHRSPLNLLFLWQRFFLKTLNIELYMRSTYSSACLLHFQLFRTKEYTFVTQQTNCNVSLFQGSFGVFVQTLHIIYWVFFLVFTSYIK